MQINRMFEMVYLLLNRERITARELAERFEVSTRTIYRDVELLSSAGIPIYMTKGKNGGVSLLPHFVLNKTVLTDMDKLEILSALQAVDAVSLEKSGKAAQRLSTFFGKSNPEWIEIDFSGWSNSDEEAEVFNRLKAAIINKQRASFLYHSSDGMTKRLIEPLRLCFKGQSWYAYGYCTSREDYRFFKLRRIKELKISDEYFDRAYTSKIFDEGKTFKDDFVEIVLKVSHEMAYRVYDEFSEYEKLSDGAFRAKLIMPRGEWIYHYIATFGEHCEVLEPEDVRLDIKEKLKKTLSLYL